MYPNCLIHKIVGICGISMKMRADSKVSEPSMLSAGELISMRYWDESALPEKVKPVPVQFPSIPKIPSETIAGPAKPNC